MANEKLVMNVLLGLEGSDESMNALRRTIERTTDAGDDLTVVIVEKPNVERTPMEMRHQTEDLLEQANVDAPVEVLEGDPGASLVEYAERGDFDELVLGGGAIGPIGKIRLGPITEYVLMNATMTVTLVR